MQFVIRSFSIGIIEVNFYLIALPHMSLYIKYCADIFDIYLDYFSPDDIHQYSIDEAFIDVTD